MPDAEERRPRRLKDRRRIPLSLRVTPQMREHLERVAELNGRSLTQQTEFVLERGLLVVAGVHDATIGEILDRAEGIPTYRAPSPSDELIGRFIRLEGEIAGLRAAVEKALDRNTTELTRAWSRLYRVLAEFEAKIASNTTETSTAVSQLQTVTAHLLAGLKRIDAARTGRREKADAPPRPRLVSTNGDKSS